MMRTAQSERGFQMASSGNAVRSALLADRPVWPSRLGSVAAEDRIADDRIAGDGATAAPLRPWSFIHLAP
jgi:hypothetical protein